MPGWAKALLATAVGMALALAAGWFGVRAIGRYLNDTVSPTPETIAAASLEGIREQNRMSAFAAQFVAVVTSEQTRIGVFKARKTMIMPGLVRYEVDLGKLTRKDVSWNAERKILSVTLPPIETSRPQIDMGNIREYDGGGLLMALTNAEQTLDAANRTRAWQELQKQAQQPMMIKMARDASRRAVERNFAMPLKAAGIDAKVEVRFADEPVRADAEQMDRSRSLAEIFANKAGD